jgi:hypothetical protein
MNRHTAAVLIAAIAVPVAAAPAMADAGRTSWPGTAVLSGAWAGTASSTTIAGFTFPVTAEVAVAATGRPTGRVVLGAPVNCRGTWSPVSTTGRVTVFAEDITSDIEGTRCLTGGTVRLSAASDGRLRYRWTKGDAASVAYLAPTGISGTWTGTITQGTLGTIRARLRVNGVRRGDMPGATDYAAPLACGGTLTPLGAGTQRAAAFTERITRSSSTVCVGEGTTTLRLRPDGRLAYRWAGAGEVSIGVLRRAR